MVSTHCIALQHITAYWHICMVPQPVVGRRLGALECCDTLQHVATHCSTLHGTATYCNTLTHMCGTTVDGREATGSSFRRYNFSKVRPPSDLTHKMTYNANLWEILPAATDAVRHSWYTHTQKWALLSFCTVTNRHICWRCIFRARHEHCNTPQHTATHWLSIDAYVDGGSFLCAMCAAAHCNTLKHAAAHCNTLQRTATQRHVCWRFIISAHHARCNTLQHTATHCNTLQHTATHRNTLTHVSTLCDFAPSLIHILKSHITPRSTV